MHNNIIMINDYKINCRILS